MEESVLELNLSLWSVAREVWREVWREGGGNSEDPGAGALTPANIRPGVNVLPKKGFAAIFAHMPIFPFMVILFYSQNSHPCFQKRLCQ